VFFTFCFAKSTGGKKGSKGKNRRFFHSQVPPVPAIAVRFLDTPKRKCGVKGLLAFFQLWRIVRKTVQCTVLKRFRRDGKVLIAEQSHLFMKMKTVQWTILIFVNKYFAKHLQNQAVLTAKKFDERSGSCGD